MKFLVTGHTGFKGSWLVVLLKELGHEVHGVALKPNVKSLYLQGNISRFLDSDTTLDIRNRSGLTDLVLSLQPEVIIHLAAQSLVLDSYRDPISTFEINLMGTMNLLSASAGLSSLRATLVVTSDKVYRPRTGFVPYIEEDPLGGVDPYSASKSAADIAVQSWRFVKEDSRIAIARAGNVIGGGDWSRNRLVPDMVAALENDSNLMMRNPTAVRPWQHVLDCLNGYRVLVENQIANGTGGEWNFGPSASHLISVEMVCEVFFRTWGKSVPISLIESRFSESKLLTLDSSFARQVLDWQEKLDFEKSIQWTVDWYKNYKSEDITLRQVQNYLSL